MSWSIVSKALERSKKTPIVNSFFSKASAMLLITSVVARLVACPGRNPNCSALRM